MTPSLNRLSMKPPVMMPKATAGRFRIPEWIKKQIQKEKGSICSEDPVTHPKLLLQKKFLSLCIEKLFQINVDMVIKKRKKYGSRNLSRSGCTC